MAEELKALTSVLRGNGEFTKRLYKIFAKDSGNFFFSPISIHAILALASQGSAGQTKEAFLNALHVPDVETAAVGYKDIISNLNSVKDVTFSMANKLFLQDGLVLLEAFDSIAQQQFLSEVGLVDFAKSQAAAECINFWVEGKTNGKIRNLIAAEDLTEDTGLVLVNAVYFKGRWRDPFKPKDTRTESFYINETEVVDVEMMHIKEHFNFKNDEDLDAKVLELPYVDRDYSLIVILPNYRKGITELEGILAHTDLTKVTENMRNVEVEVDLPKFKIEQTIDLKQPLTEVGLGDIFDRYKADFSGIVNNRSLYVSKVVQKAFIEVNEEGTEAAAATGMQMMLCCAPPEPEKFIADHPFVIILQVRQERTVNILFSGRVYEPIY